MPSFDRDTRGRKSRLSPAFLLVCALCLVFAGNASAAPPNWLDPADLSTPGRDASNPVVEMDAAGNTIALWERQSVADPSFNTQISTRAVGGSFSAPVELALHGTEPQLAIAAGGEAVAAWKRRQGLFYVIEAAVRPPGGSFSAPVTVHTMPAESIIPQDVRVAIGSGGDIAITWSSVDVEDGADFKKLTCAIQPMTGFPIPCSNPSLVEGSVRPAGGSFTPAQRISKPRGTAPDGETDPEREEREKLESTLDAIAARPSVDSAGNVTVIWSAFDGENFVVQSASRPAGGAFSAPILISAPGEQAGSGDIDVDSAGNTIVSWLQQEGSVDVVRAAIKGPAGSFAPLGSVSIGGGPVRPVLDVAPNGTAILVWRIGTGADSFLQAATRLPGGAFSAPVNVNSGKDNPTFHEVALAEEGDAIVVWSGENGANEIVRAAVRSPGAVNFGAPVAISQSSSELLHPRTSIGAGGDATVVWVRHNGSHRIVQWAGYDADPPQLRDLSIPSSAKVADTVQFSASAFDVWPVGAPSFEFGDGARADGSAVSHVYSAPGAYPITVSVTDAGGRTSSSSATLLVKARNFFTIGKLKQNRKKGTATLSVTIPEPGSLTTSAKGIKKTTVRSAKGATVKIPLKGAGKGLKRLKKTGKLKAKLKIAYSPVGGDINTQIRGVTLKKALRGARRK